VLAPLIRVGAEPGINAGAIAIHQRQAGLLGGTEGGENAGGSMVRSRVFLLAAWHHRCSPTGQTIGVGKRNGRLMQRP